MPGAFDIAGRLRVWADARESRNTPGGHGKVGTALLREAADEVDRLRKIETAHRQEFLDDCMERGFSPREAQERLGDFKRDALAVSSPPAASEEKDA